jgi:hypothetical protein
VTVYALPETGLVATMLGSLGVATAAGTVDDDLSAWAKAGLTVGGDSSGYTLNAVGTGENTRRINDISTGETPHRMSLTSTVAGGTSEWVRFIVGGASAWIHLTNGEVGASSTVDTTPVVVDAGGGSWDITVIQEVTSASGVLIQPADGDGATKATSTIDEETMLTVKDVVFEQTRAVDWTSQQPLTPVASQASAESQPGYDDATLSFDGDDDYLTLNEELGAQTSWTLMFLADVPAAGGAERTLFDAETGRLLIRRLSTGELGVYDTGDHKITIGAIATAVLTLLLDSVGGTMSLLVNDEAQTFDDASYAGVPLGGAINFGATYTGANPFNGSQSGFVCYSRVLTGDDLTNAKAFLTAYGQSIGVL